MDGGMERWMWEEEKEKRGGQIKPDLCHGAFMAAGKAVGGNGWEEALCALSVRL